MAAYKSCQPIFPQLPPVEGTGGSIDSKQKTAVSHTRIIGNFATGYAILTLTLLILRKDLPWAGWPGAITRRWLGIGA